MVLTLAAMNRDDFARRRGPLVAGYATAIASARRLPMAAAVTEAERSVTEKVPRGPATPGQLMRKAVAGGAEVGWIWVTLPEPTRPTMAWLTDVEVDPEHRSRGYACAIIEAVEAELTGLGVPRLGLNVFGDNETALRLYDRLGFQVTAQQRSRLLAEVPASDGIELIPMIDYAARIEALFADYAHDLIQEEGLWHGEAEDRAARKLAELLPHGPQTEGMILRTAVAEGKPVGWVWAEGTTPARPGLGWLHSIDIDEGHRSRGYGRAVIAAIEAELAGRGVPSLGLNVHGYNVGAQRLYERLGYELQAQQMVKELPTT